MFACIHSKIMTPPNPQGKEELSHVCNNCRFVCNKCRIRCTKGEQLICLECFGYEDMRKKELEALRAQLGDVQETLNIREAQIAEFTYALSDEQKHSDELAEAAKGYLGNGHEPTDGDIVHVPEHCRQCKLEKALENHRSRRGGNNG